MTDSPDAAWPSEPAYPMPEDPPQFGDDGLDFMANPVGYTEDDGSVMKKYPFEKVDEGAGAPRTKNADPALAEIERADAERRERVWKRRHPTNPILKVFQLIIPYGGILSSAFNLASSTIGAGIVALPAAFQVSGMIMSIIYLLIVALLAVYSFVLLAIVAEKTGLRNWEKITRRLLGPGADYFLAFIMWFLCFGGDVSYIISVGSVLRGYISNSSSASDYLKSTPGIRLLTSVVWLVCILPLCISKEINSLRIVSTLAILFVIFFVICIIVHSGKSLHANGVRDDIVMFQTGNQAVQGLSIYMFAYVAQVNAYEVYGEQYKPSVKRMFLSSLLGVGMCTVLYFLAGFFGYMDFGPTVEDTVLTMYNPIQDPLMGVSYAGMLLKLCVGFALHLIPCRDAVYHVIKVDVHDVPWWKNAVLCVIQATVALIAGLFIPRIMTVFGLLGGFCGGFIGFVFPALFMMYSGGFTIRRTGWPHFIGTYALLLVGVIAVVFGTAAAVYGEVIAD